MFYFSIQIRVVFNFSKRVFLRYFSKTCSNLFHKVTYERMVVDERGLHSEDLEDIIKKKEILYIKEYNVLL